MSNEVEIVVSAKDKTGGGFGSATKGAKEYGKGLENVGEKADKSEQKVLGMKDTVDGVATIMQGPGKQGIAAYLQGWADLASGVANFIVPAVQATVAVARHAIAVEVATIKEKIAAGATKAWAAVQWLLNAALNANPIGIIIVLIAALVAGIILAWKHSDTFRRIVTAAFKAVGEAAKWLWEKAIRPAFEAIKNTTTSVINWFKDIPGKIATAFSNARDWLIEKGKDILRGLLNGLRNYYITIFSWFGARKNSIFKALGNVGSWLFNKGKDILNGLWNGIKNIWNSVVGWFKDVPKHILNALGIHSPPDWAIDAGKHIMGGLLKGMGLNSQKVLDYAKGFTQSLGPGLSGKGLPGYTGKGPQVGNLGINQILVKNLAAADYGWTGSEWNALYNLIMGESGFNPNAQNPTSTAYGMFQFLNSTWASVGARKSSLPYDQAVAGLKYIAQRYFTPSRAYGAWLSRSPHWYGKGGLITEPIAGIGLRSGQSYGFGEKGTETVIPGNVSGTGGGQPLSINLILDGKKIAEVMLDPFRNIVRTKGGNVQAVLGS